MRIYSTGSDADVWAENWKFDREPLYEIDTPNPETHQAPAIGRVYHGDGTVWVERGNALNKVVALGRADRVQFRPELPMDYVGKVERVDGTYTIYNSAGHAVGMCGPDVESNPVYYVIVAEQFAYGTYVVDESGSPRCAMRSDSNPYPGGGFSPISQVLDIEHGCFIALYSGSGPTINRLAAAYLLLYHLNLKETLSCRKAHSFSCHAERYR